MLLTQHIEWINSHGQLFWIEGDLRTVSAHHRPDAATRRRYRFDYEEQDHIELLELLKTLPCNVILSGYPSALYDERLTGWRTLELQVMNHAGVRTEKLWFNFTPDRVHWASWRGQEFHRPPAHQAPCRELGEELPGTTREERLAVLAAMMAVGAEDAAGSG